MTDINLSRIAGYNSYDALVDLLLNYQWRGKKTEEDILIRVPEIENLYLKANDIYEKEYEVYRKLVYLAYDIPEGVTLILYRNNSSYYWATGEIGALEFHNGIYFDKIGIKVENNTNYSQKWSCTMIFV